MQFINGTIGLVENPKKSRINAKCRKKKFLRESPPLEPHQGTAEQRGLIFYHGSAAGTPLHGWRHSSLNHEHPTKIVTDHVNFFRNLFENNFRK
jgi:hypothetical protein